MFNEGGKMAYYFKPMMPFYSRFASAPVEWLESAEGRNLMAKTLRHCRKNYGTQAATEFRDAMVWLGVMPVWLRVARREEA
jgi:hypothetical protein